MLNESRAPRVFAANAAAEKWGVVAGDLLADARARLIDLQIRRADPAADRAALEKLALWATRYTPIVTLFDEAEGADGFYLDVTGATHLFGGEKALLVDLAARLQAFGLPARIALAASAGAAFALARHDGRRMIRAAIGEDRAALRDLPVEGLRLPRPTIASLKRLGFTRIGDLMETPRAPLTVRFGGAVLRRLDQALGLVPEATPPLQPVTLHHAAMPLLEPIATHEAIVEVAMRLMEDLAPALEREGSGARNLVLTLHRVDGGVLELELGLAAPSRDAAHLGRLVRLELDRRAHSAPRDEGFETGFGFEVLRLAVTASEPIEARQPALAFSAETVDAQERLTVLIDVIRHRLGGRSLKKFVPHESHRPERAVIAQALEGQALDEQAPAWPANDDHKPPRPIMLLDPAEPVEVVALAPEGEPRRFRWRGRSHRVAQSEGPERVGAEWWLRRAPSPSRDYYLVEDDSGHRFWLFREGLLGRETMQAQWFVHGLFV